MLDLKFSTYDSSPGRTKLIIYKGHTLEKKTCFRDWNIGYKSAGGEKIYKIPLYIFEYNFTYACATSGQEEDNQLRGGVVDNCRLRCPGTRQFLRSDTND